MPRAPRSGRGLRTDGSSTPLGGRPAPRLGWFTWLLIGFAVLLVTPLFVGKMVRAAGWFFRQWTGGRCSTLLPWSSG